MAGFWDVGDLSKSCRRGPANCATRVGATLRGPPGEPEGHRTCVHVVMWFLIASEQITRAKNHVNKSMTMEQLLDAEQRAADWMRKTKKMPPSSIENPPNASST